MGNESQGRHQRHGVEEEEQVARERAMDRTVEAEVLVCPNEDAG